MRQARSRQSQKEDLKGLVDAYERSLIEQALTVTHGHQLQAAKLLGLLPTTLCTKMRRMHIRSERQMQSRFDARSKAMREFHSVPAANERDDEPAP